MADKQDRLSKLTDEVSELHPLLQRLLPKLPTVKHVDYTHGNTEMGADFVVTKAHEVFGDHEYVGVIAKLGKVVQDFSDLERQIAECWIPRPVGGGKRRVRLNEVWVILTGHITKGAQEKIHDKFEAAKIQFLPGSRLIELIDRYMPDYWTSVDLAVGEYLSLIRERNDAADRALSFARRSDDATFYIEQDVVRVVDDDYSRKHKAQTRAARVDFPMELARHKLLVVEGGMGSGKSKLLRRMVAHFSAPDVFLREKLLPVPISYNDFVDAFASDPERLLRGRVSDAVRSALQDDCRYLLLLDALDEKDQSLDGQREALRALSAIVHARTDLTIVVTSRYLSSMGSFRALGVAAVRYELRALSLSRVIEFLTTLCATLNVKSRILQDLKKSPLFRELPKSPIAAIILAQLLNENSKDLPSNMTELYAKYVELMLGRWDIEKGLQSQKEYEALDNVFMQLAEFFVKNELPSVSREEARSYFDAYLRARNLGIDSDGLFQRAITRSEILIEDPLTGTIAFKHRTFAEFLYARSLLRQGTYSIDRRVFQPYWLSVFFFLLGLKKDTPDALREIIDLQPISQDERVMKFVNMGSYLLAAYSTPYEVITDGVTCAVQEAARFYVDLVEGRSESFFTRLPRMTALYLLQHLMREAYSYAFFRDAIEEAALRVDDDGEDARAVKAYALFFLNVAMIDLEDVTTFDFLLEDYKGQLPLDLALAVKHEGDRAHARSALMKQNERRILRLLKEDKALSSQIELLYERPLKSLKQVSKRRTLPKNGA